MRLLFAVVFAVGCGGSKGPVAPKEPERPADVIPKTEGPECKVVAEQLVQMLLADKPDRHEKAIGIVTQRCTEDGWSDEARSCAAAAQNADEADGCVKHLTPAQKDAMQGAAKQFEDGDGDASVGEAKPAPTGRTTRGAVQKSRPQPKGADPCAGGEIADPCMGGQ